MRCFCKFSKFKIKGMLLHVVKSKKASKNIHILQKDPKTVYGLHNHCTLGPLYYLISYVGLYFNCRRRYTRLLI